MLIKDLIGNTKKNYKQIFILIQYDLLNIYLLQQDVRMSKEI